MKRVSLILIFLAVTAAVCSAVDFDFVVGQKTSASLEFDNSAGDMKPKFLFNVDAELDMDFSQGHGMLVAVNPYSTGGSVEFARKTSLYGRTEPDHAFQQDDLRGTQRPGRAGRQFADAAAEHLSLRERDGCRASVVG